MSKINWAAGPRYYHIGISHGVLYLQNADGTYANGVAWNGLTAVTETPTGGEKTSLYADNILYAEFRSDEGLDGTIEAYMYPREFSFCNGAVEVEDGVKVLQQRRKKFGFCYRTMISDKDYILHVLYGVSVDPEERNHVSMSDNPEITTYSWDFTTTPVRLDGLKPASSISIDSRLIDDFKMHALEDLLYGTDSSDPTLPSMAEVIEIAVGFDFRRLLVEAFSTLKLWRWDPFNFLVDTVQIAIDRESNLRVHFAPSSGQTFEYPCITYKTIDNADYDNPNSEYYHKKHYEVTVITLTQTSSVITAVAAIPTATLTSSTQSGGKYYNVYSIYY